ncbi:MAG: TetR/AcrR family transcriptional regulator [Acidimicrobiaceae bacterium]|nr:TetR/AcrR family transcriptional regulator [Acidimicrobiaceae bacterium]
MAEGTAGAEAGRQLRADAQRNRARLISTATKVFAAEGTDVALEEIARQAGVGIGTLYRHFPTREALIEAVYRNEVEVLRDSADTLLAQLPPEEALAEWMQRFVAYVATKRGLVAALKGMLDVDASLFDDSRKQLIEAAGRLLDAGAKTGVVRGDVDAADLVRAMGGICMAADQGRSVDQSRSIVGLLLDGLRFGARTPG